MKEDQPSALQQLERTDDLLLGMDTTMQFIGMGIENMANGQQVYDMLCHFRNTIQDARALLDDARSAIVQKQLTA